MAAQKKRERAHLPSPEVRLRLESSVLWDDPPPQPLSQLLLHEEERKRHDDDADEPLLRSLDIDHDQQIVKEFNDAIERNVRDLESLNDIANDLGLEIASQGEVMADAEENLNEADAETMAGVGELGEAVKTQSKTRTTKSMLAGAGSCALTFGVAGAVLGPPGSATGALVGAMVGAALGAGVGAGLGFGVGKAMDQTSAVERDQIALSNARIFLPLSASALCMNCHVTFSLFVHAHHCRLCGCVVCSACLREEAVSYPHVEAPVKCRVCIACVSANAPLEVGSRHPCPVHKIHNGEAARDGDAKVS